VSCARQRAAVSRRQQFTDHNGSAENKAQKSKAKYDPAQQVRGKRSFKAASDFKDAPSGGAAADDVRERKAKKKAARLAKKKTRREKQNQADALKGKEIREVTEKVNVLAERAKVRFAQLKELSNVWLFLPAAGNQIMRLTAAVERQTGRW
jgi:hypothetical protein